MRERERQSAHTIAIASDRDRTGSRDWIEIAIAPDLVTGSRSRSHRTLRLDRDRDLAFARSHRIEIAVDASRDRAVDRNLAKIAISPSRDRAVDRDLGSRSRHRSRSRTGAGARDLGLELELAISDWIFSSCARALSLSLSLSFIFRKCFEGKIEV